MDYIEFDGLTVREMMARETDLSIMDTTIIATYSGAANNAKGLQITFNGSGVNLVDLEVEHIVTIKKGFRTPLYGE